MKVFVAGATGVIGRAAVQALLDRGHTVVATVRSAESAAAVRRLGARAVEADVFDRGSLAEALGDCEAAVRLTTRVPPLSRLRFRRAWRENGRLGTTGARVLTQAALERGVRLYVHQSMTFLYADGGDRWLDEQAPTHAPRPPMADAAAGEHEAARFVARGGGRAVVLRFGCLYAADTPIVQELVPRMQRRRVTMPGAGDNYLSSIHAHDAGTAVAAALEAPVGVYNIVDDEPVQLQEYLRSLAAAAGAPPLRRVPAAVARLLMGRIVADCLLRSRRVSNAAFKQAAGWRPAYPRVTEESWKVPIER